MPSLYEPFNPYKLFHGSFIPEWLECRPVKECSVGAKLIYARLTRYSGKDGKCYPPVDHIAEATGYKKRQIEKILKELKDLKLIKSIRLGKKCTNRYVFLWHPWIADSIHMHSDTHNSAVHGNSDTHNSADPMDTRNSADPYKENQVRESDIPIIFEERWKEYSEGFEDKSKLGDVDKKLNRLSKKDYELLLSQRDAYFLVIQKKRKKWDQYPMKSASTFLTPKYWKNATWVVDIPPLTESSVSDKQSNQTLNIKSPIQEHCRYVDPKADTFTQLTKSCYESADTEITTMHDNKKVSHPVCSAHQQELMKLKTFIWFDKTYEVL